MNRIVIPIVIVIALVIGAFAGFRYAEHRYGHSVTDTITTYEFGRAVDAFSILRDLRAGDTNAVFGSLEGDLDDGVLALHEILDDYPAVEHAKNYTNLLRRIADYRTAYPYRSDFTNVDASVKGILTQIKNAK